VTWLPQPGDIVLAHSDGLMGKAIRFGERIRWGEKPSHWNHVAIVDRIEDGVAYVIQAEPRGVTNDKPLSSVGEYEIVLPPDEANVERLLQFARSQVGSHYGWASIVSVAFDIATPNWFPSFRRPGTWICSALGAEALRYAGWLRQWPDIYCVTPAQMYAALISPTRMDS